MHFWGSRVSRAGAGGDWEPFVHPPSCVRCWFGSSSPIRQSSDIPSVGLEQLQPVRGCQNIGVHGLMPALRDRPAAGCH